jgi:hypothetical protein
LGENVALIRRVLRQRVVTVARPPSAGEITQTSEVFRFVFSPTDYDSNMASERTARAMAPEPTHHAAWDKLERPSDARALAHSADHAAVEAFLLAAAQTQGIAH